MRLSARLTAIIWGVISLTGFWPTSAGSQNTTLSLADTRKTFEKSVVFIAVEYETAGKDGTPEAGCKTGSGVLVSSAGYIITTEHLFRDSKGVRYPKMFVTGSVGASFDCSRKTGLLREMTIVSSSGENDIALLKFKASDVFEPVRVCRQTKVDDGEDMYVLGFPLGQQLAAQTVTKSNESGPRGAWMFSGAINSGDSGGPIFTKFGRLVGIAKGSIDNAANIGYMVPVNLFLDRLQAGGATLQDCITVSGPAEATGCRPVVKTVPVDFVLDDHSSLDSKAKMFSEVYHAESGYKIKGWNWNVTSSSKASGADIAPTDDRSSIRITTTLSSGPLYDRWRGWLDGRLELIQVKPECLAQ